MTFFSPKILRFSLTFNILPTQKKAIHLMLSAREPRDGSTWEGLHYVGVLALRIDEKTTNNLEKMELEAFVNQLREELKLGAMLPSDRLSDFPKAFRLELDNHLDISLKEKNPGIWMKAPLRARPDVKLEELLAHLMEANLFGQGTRGSSISLDESGDILELQLEVKHELNYRGFRDAIEDFANLIEYWQSRIDAHIEENASME